MQLENGPLLLTRQDEMMTLTFNRAAVLNAIDLAMVEQLHAGLHAAAQDGGVRAVIITGHGRGFCAGGDLRFALAANPAQPGDSFLALTTTLHQCVELIRTMAKPVIAAINGVAAGAGLFLALACDLRVMADTACLKQSNTSYGLSLPRLVGVGRTLEIVMLDEPITAEQAQLLGLTTRVVRPNELLPTAQRLGRQVAQMPLETLGRVKGLLNQAFATTLSEQLAAERIALAASANSAEGREGLAAFVTKRQPMFNHAQAEHAAPLR